MLPDTQERGIRLLTFRGTSVHVEISFLILIGLFVFLDLERGVPFRNALLWIPILFLSVLLHEAGHAAAIGLLRFGPSEIRLASLGGVTINRRAAKPWQEIVISLAGPAMSFALAAGSFAVMVFAGEGSLGPFLGALLPETLRANILWGIFNLLPVHPLDGGHVVQQIARKLARPVNAIRASAYSSLVFSAILLVYGIMRTWIFLAILAALFGLQNWQRLAMLREAIRENSSSEPPDER